MFVNLIILVAALIVSWLVFTALIKLLNTTVSTAIAIAAVVLILQLLFGIGPGDLVQEIIHLPRTLWHLVKGK